MAGTGRESWGSRAGFILAAIGSAVGLGNMWRFSYLAAQDGGAAFVLLYVLLTLGMGLPILLAEFAIGRSARSSPALAFSRLGAGGFGWLGALMVLIPFGVLSYYSVIAGWTARYAFEAITTGFGGDSGARFGEISAGWDAALWHVAFMGVTVAIVAGGIRGGIERAARWLMPVLFVTLVALAGYAATLPGAAAGYAFFLAPDFSRIASTEVWVHAAGQAFFSLSVATGVMLTYASYLPEEGHLPGSALWIGAADFAVAFIAGLAVFPLIFALGLSDQMVESAVGALFIVLPSTFQAMGPAGTLIGFVFFAALAVAALTSTISALEVVVAGVTDRLGGTRLRAALLAGAAITLCGLGPAHSTDLLGLLDTIVGNVGLLLVGLALSLFTGWRLEAPIERVARGAPDVRWFPIWLWLLRVPVPLLLAFLLYQALRGLTLA